MRRYYAHYTFIYPDTYLKNVIVELNADNKIAQIIPFEKEIEKTEFFSGVLVFISEDIASDDYDESAIEAKLIKKFETSDLEINYKRYSR